MTGAYSRKGGQSVNIDFRETNLMRFLHAKAPDLLAKIGELRETVIDWLSYIPQSFPHYTRHTVQHSDAILLQVSKLLFRSDSAQPVIQISPMEAYIIGTSAYLHDAGMVVSDSEKTEILQTEEWRRWAEEGGSGTKRWHEVKQFRDGDHPADPALRSFLADVQTRFLIAEYIRRIHHLRSGSLIRQREDQLGRFAFADHVLLRTIADVCVAHGLKQEELEDRERYPDRRDIRGYQVNVRFCAILLRLGDLLEMSADRACPLLLNAACPLPSESFAHWTQYQRIEHTLTAPDLIEIIAKCENQDEHRFLKDWCQWLVDEVRNAGILMSHASRHSDWQLPKASIDCPDATIRIIPADSAKYIPTSWKFELDHAVVFERLIRDLYEDPKSYLRELIQNALDATRCQLYVDLAKDGLELPEFPTQVRKEIRNRYPLKVRLDLLELPNQLSGEKENRQILTVEDSGLGMDRDVVQRYLLQVGRSYYVSPDFQRSFKFVPTSKFGVGFLSVFGASDHVTIESYKPNSFVGDGPLRLVLTGPRNYLLLEKGDRQRNGTRISVLLREPMKQGELSRAISGWCRRVEFPIHVSDLGSETVVISESKTGFVYDLPDITDERVRFLVRAFDTDTRGIEGELYVFARIDDRGESWAAWSYAQYRYPEMHPQATAPTIPQSLRCLHGITIDQGYVSGPISARLDYRGPDAPRPGLSRHRSIPRWFESNIHLDTKLEPRWEGILKEHLASTERNCGSNSWKYRQALVDDFPFPVFWDSLPETILAHKKGDSELFSLAELKQVRTLASVLDPPDGDYPFYLGHADSKTQEPRLPAWVEEIPALFQDDLNSISDRHVLSLFSEMQLVRTSWLPAGQLALYWEKNGSKNIELSPQDAPHPRPSVLIPLSNSYTIAFEMHKTSDKNYPCVLFNSLNPLVQWLFRVKDAAKTGDSGITQEQYKKLLDVFYDAVRFLHTLSRLASFLNSWRTIVGLPDALYPPSMELSVYMFARVQNPEQARPTHR